MEKMVACACKVDHLINMASPYLIIWGIVHFHHFLSHTHFFIGD